MSVEFAQVYVCSGIKQADRDKLAYALRAKETNPFPETDVAIDDEVCAALRWQAVRTRQERRSEREEMVPQIEFAAAQITASGMQHDWLARADPEARRVIKHVNGPLLEQLLTATSYKDVNVVSMLRDGAPMMGKLDSCGFGEHRDIGLLIIVPTVFIMVRACVPQARFRMQVPYGSSARAAMRSCWLS